MRSHQLRAHDARRPRGVENLLPADFSSVERPTGADFGPLDGDLARNLSVSPWRSHLVVDFNDCARPHRSLRRTVEGVLAARGPLAIQSGPRLYVDFSLEDDVPACRELAERIGAFVVGLVPGSTLVDLTIMHHAHLADGLAGGATPRSRHLQLVADPPGFEPNP